MPNSQCNQVRDMLGSSLSERIENSVPAADIGFDRVFGADSIAQL